MASIPLPALDVRTPQQPDLLEKYGQLLQLKNAQQQSQMQQQEAPLRMQALQQGVESGKIGLEQAQQGQQDQLAFRAAMQDPSLQGERPSEQVADAIGAGREDISVLMGSGEKGRRRPACSSCGARRKDAG
jgi:hypothetical protein